MRRVGYKSSGEKTSDTPIVAVAAQLGGVLVITDGTNDATLILYDNASAASGTKLFEAVVAGGDNYGGMMFSEPVECMKGIYGDVAGTGASYVVYYRER